MMTLNVEIRQRGRIFALTEGSCESSVGDGPALLAVRNAGIGAEILINGEAVRTSWTSADGGIVAEIDLSNQIVSIGTQD